jgi:hypothetical protein
LMPTCLELASYADTHACDRDQDWGIQER